MGMWGWKLLHQKTCQDKTCPSLVNRVEGVGASERLRASSISILAQPPDWTLLCLHYQNIYFRKQEKDWGHIVKFMSLSRSRKLLLCLWWFSWHGMCHLIIGEQIEKQLLPLHYLKAELHTAPLQPLCSNHPLAELEVVTCTLCFHQPHLLRYSYRAASAETRCVLRGWGVPTERDKNSQYFPPTKGKKRPVWIWQVIIFEAK